MPTSPPTPLPAHLTTAGNPADKTVGLDPKNRAFLFQIAQEIRRAPSPTWKRHWKDRYGLPPHPQFARFVKREAPSLSPTELLRHLEREHRLEVRAQASLRQDFRHAQPDRYRVLLREVRAGLRDTVVPTQPSHRGNPRKKPGNPVPS